MTTPALLLLCSSVWLFSCLPGNQLEHRNVEYNFVKLQRSCRKCHRAEI